MDQYNIGQGKLYLMNFLNFFEDIIKTDEGRFRRNSSMETC